MTSIPQRQRQYELDINHESYTLMLNKYSDKLEYSMGWYDMKVEEMERWKELMEKHYETKIIPLAVYYRIMGWYSPTEFNRLRLRFMPEFLSFLYNKLPTMFKTWTLLLEHHKSRGVKRFIILVHIAEYIGIPPEEFYTLAKDKPSFCNDLFDLEDLIWGWIDYDHCNRMYREQKELMQERREFMEKARARSK